MKVWELLSDESKWTIMADARDGQGRAIAADDSEAVQWCLLGALRRCYGPHDGDAYVRLVKGTRGVISLFNDAPRRTFAEVHALVKELDI